MGAFILYKEKDRGAPGFHKMESDAKSIFERVGLPFNGCFNLGSHSLLLYSKLDSDRPNFCSDEEGNFIAATGSLVYKSLSGLPALKLLLTEFSHASFSLYNCTGHYCVIINKYGKVHLFRDALGVYPVYSNEELTVVSSSFLATTCFLRKYTILENEFYEYLYNGFWYGFNTLISEIKLLPYGRQYNLTDTTFIEPVPVFKDLSSLSYTGVLENVSESLRGHFNSLALAFNKRVAIGLSGGYDSRLILAIMESLGVKTELYVNGPDDSTDVLIASSLASKLNRSIDHVKYYRHYPETTEEKLEGLRERFLFYDGLGSAGIFDNYSDIDFKLKLGGFAKVVLNGGGGEIYRESWNLPNRRFTIDAFVNSRYNKYDFRSVMVKGTGRIYLEHMSKLLSGYLGREHLVSRVDIEKLHLVRHKAIHFIAGWNSYFNPFILPFHESFLMLEAGTIPMKYKNNRKLNIDLIRQFSPLLSEVMSAYGYPFSGDVPVLHRIKESMYRNLPLGLKPAARKLRKPGRAMVQPSYNNYLSEDVLKTIFNTGNLKISEYVNKEYLGNGHLLSRAMSIELLIRFLEGEKSISVF